MNTNVDLLHYPKRRKPWTVRWWSTPDPVTNRQKRPGRSFLYARDAKAFHAEKCAEIGRKGLGEPVCVALEHLIAEFTEARISRLSHVSQIGYANTFEQLLEFFGGSRLIHTIEQRHAETFLSSRGRVDGRPGDIATWTRLRHLIHCRALFGAAVAWNYVDRNPFIANAADKGSPLRITAKGRSWHHITPREFQRFLAVVITARQRTVYWLMYGCGLRPGEVHNLTANCLDLSNRRVHVINRTATKDLPGFTVKAERQSSASKERSVPIPESAIPDLTESMRSAFQAGGLAVISPERFVRIREHWARCQDGLGWAGHSHRQWQNRDMVNNVVRDTKKLFRAAGIELSAPFTLSTFRKSFAQNHADAGTPPKTLAKLLGHSDSRVTMQFYNRVTDANDRAAREVMDRVLGMPEKTSRAM